MMAIDFIGTIFRCANSGPWDMRGLSIVPEEKRMVDYCEEYNARLPRSTQIGKFPALDQGGQLV
jgi:hypothetical protein